MGDLLTIKKGNHYHRSIDMTAMLDNTLSLQAKGLHYYLQTRPDNWKIWFTNLIKFSTNGETSVRSALNELAASGYLLRVQLRDEKKQIIRMLYISLEKPDAYSNLELDNLLLGNLNLGFKVYSYNIYSSKTISTKVLSKDLENPTSLLEDSAKTNYKRNSRKKDTKEKPIIKCELPFLLKEWRTFEQIPKSQHHPIENSKQHQRANMYTKLLMEGKFGAHCSIDPKFLSDNKLTKSVLTEKFTKEELSDGLYEMSKMFMEGNYPEDKTSIRKRSFADLIYCPRTRISYLLKYLYKDVQPLAYKTVQVYDHWIEKLYTERLFDRDIENDNHQFGILKKGLSSIEEYYGWLTQQPMKGLLFKYKQIDTEDKFFNTYIDWLGNTYNSTSINANPWMIGSESKSWYKFIKWLEEAIHGDYVHKYPTLDKRKY